MYKLSCIPVCHTPRLSWALLELKSIIWYSMRKNQHAVDFSWRTNRRIALFPPTSCHDKICSVLFKSGVKWTWSIPSGVLLDRLSKVHPTDFCLSGWMLFQCSLTTQISCIQHYVSVCIQRISDAFIKIWLVSSSLFHGQVCWGESLLYQTCFPSLVL